MRKLKPKQAELVNQEIRLICYWLSTRASRTSEERRVYDRLACEIGMFKYIDELVANGKA